MCGIFATTRPDLWRDKAPEILDLLRHRGPDAAGIWESPDRAVLFAHTRLAIIGLGSEGAQPATLCSEHTLTFNGEIYNYRELAVGLGEDVSTSDTQTLLHLLARDGTASLSRLRGMYALAWWDDAARTLVAARDTWGIKPLYQLDHGDGGVTLCSELGPLLLLAEARRIDPVGLAQYLAFGHTVPSATLFGSITKVPPGVALAWHIGLDGRISSTSERIEPGRAPAVPLDDALRDSVRAHLVADVEVGVFLSAGIDSTLIASYARDHVSALSTYSISFPEMPKIDESPLAKSNASALGTRHRTFPVTVDRMVGALDRFLDVNGEPSGDPAALALTMLAADVAGDTKVVLTGEGADEMFGGYRRYDVSKYLDGSIAAAIATIASPLADVVYRHRSDRPVARAVEALLRAGPHGHAALLGSDLPALERSCPEGRDVARRFRSDWREAAGPARGREAARRFDVAQWLPNTYLEKTDRATMAAGVEARTPFLDPVIAASIVTPPLHSGKQMLRRLLVGRFPDVRLPSRKKGLAVPVERLLEAGLDGDLRRALESRDSLITSVLGRACAGELAKRAERSATTAYRLAVLARWQARMGF